MNTPFFISWRYQRTQQKNRLVSLIALFSSIGIALGVAVLIVGLSAMNGFEKELNQRVLSVVPHAELTSYQNGQLQPIEKGDELENLVKNDPNVTATLPFVSFTALIEKGVKLKIVQVKGISAEKQQKASALHQFIDQSEWQAFKKEGGLILGAGIARGLGVQKGDDVTLLLPETKGGTQLKQPQRFNLTVTGILRLEGQLDHSYALLPIETAQQFLGYQPQQYSGIEFSVKAPFNIQKLRLPQLHQFPQPLYQQTWIDKFGYMYNDIHLIRTIMYIAMVLVIGVACFNIISTLVMTVKDKQGDIAIQRTLGANNRFIQQIFLWYGLISGMKGAVAGIILGCIVSLNLTSIIKGIESLVGIHFLSDGIYFINFLPSELHLLDIVWVLLATIILSLIASLYPAIRASKLQPAKVLSGH
ncbi:lipoprotein-releasing ABC transporter permease subunit LolE [Phocoenobacter skyensis]|uniref:Lipoprotein-releasing system permease protein n=1 Tax=Phocoenobacter skyensis TaxID=97481 RepID=A0A1H7V115_9PAST|nr:lipoprotein-releasing ABC transporter permease subunit LolE [Pasteurella skyensis]MDP8184754.1 lipoprotein-releasing ABC transporter permease subunit LolE [Pasteurella skyensis]QLB23224.1 lipoprotein transporter subunit LolE [Pasteurella skyensis]SEM02931.1 lipoprotein-releasing system permease protein [Pasteurella skyensis]